MRFVRSSFTLVAVFAVAALAQDPAKDAKPKNPKKDPDQIGNRQVGLLADRVLDIVSFEPAKIQPVPQVTRSSLTSFLSGLVTIDNAMLALIDLPNLLLGTEVENIVTH